MFENKNNSIKYCHDGIHLLIIHFIYMRYNSGTFGYNSSFKIYGRRNYTKVCVHV